MRRKIEKLLDFFERNFEGIKNFDTGEKLFHNGFRINFILPQIIRNDFQELIEQAHNYGWPRPNLEYLGPTPEIPKINICAKLNKELGPGPP